MPSTDFDSRALILGQLWVNFKEDDEWKEFFAYSDLGLPLAFSFAEGIIDRTPSLEQYINETWDLFIGGLGIEDEGFARLEDIFPEA
jgi:hypothetical protein